jgi:hypothetical protein
LDADGEDCFANWHPAASLSQKTHVKLFLRKSSTEYNYIFIGDDKLKWTGSTEFAPPVSEKYIQIPFSVLADTDEEALLAIAKNRILKNFVYGNSLSVRCSTGNNADQIERLSQFLVQEQLLLRALLRASPSMAEHRESVA